MKKVLEIGCGHGFNVANLSKGAEAIGVDLSPEDIAVAKERYPGADFRVMNAEKLEFKDSQFDAVYALDILEHVDDIDVVVKEMGRVVKSGGQAIVNVPAEKSEKWLLSLRPTYFKEIHHARVFTGNQMEDLFTKNGFQIIKRRPHNFIQHFELFYLFKKRRSSTTQLGIGNWRESLDTKLVHVLLTFFDPVVLKTPAKYLPLWVVTLPIGFVINLVGNRIFPKSINYRFQKI